MRLSRNIGTNEARTMALNRALIFFGPPGAGKGTQAKKVAEKFHVPHLSTGDMFRDAIARGTELGRLAKPIMDRGELVPDEIVMGMVEERLKRPDCSAGVVFDGFPRTVPQAQQLETILKRLGFGKPVVVDFEVDEDTLVRRIAGRWTCSVGGEIYNVYEAAPKVPGICDRDGGTLVQRPDDRPEVFRERLRAYERQTKPLEDYYRKQGVLETLDGSGPVEKVSQELATILELVGTQEQGRDGHL